MFCFKHGAMINSGVYLAASIGNVPARDFILSSISEGSKIRIWRCLDGYSTVGGENKGFPVLVPQERKLCEVYELV